MYDEMTAASITVTLEQAPDQTELDALNASLGTLPGSRLSDVHGTQITVEYYREVTTDSLVKKAIRDAGVTIAPPKKQGFMERTLNRMAENNRKAFGSGTLDCCSLNDEQR